MWDGGAEETVRLVDAASALVSRHLRVRAERTRPIDLAAGRQVRRDDLGGRLALFAPLLERVQRVEGVGAFAAAAMRHPRREEQPHRLIHLLTAHGLDQPRVVIHRRARRDVLVGPPVIDEQLAPASGE